MAGGEWELWVTYQTFDGGTRTYRRRRYPSKRAAEQAGKALVSSHPRYLNFSVELAEHRSQSGGELAPQR